MTRPREPRSWRRSKAIRVACALALATTTASAGSLRISSDFGPENAVRPVRSQTLYIVLHTTEGRETGSLRKLRRRGEAHYFVQRNGRVIRLIDHRRVATHAGLSMWKGRRDLDEVSLGIEVSGYHNQEPARGQYAAVRELIRQLQSLYDIPDDRVLTHSMVAYGEANRFHHYPHRGRKRCAMVFADPAVRSRLGLSDAPARDPDVAAGRLRAGDRELQRRLYPGVSTAVRVAEAPHVEAPRAEAPRAGGPVEVITPTRTAWSIAGRAYASATTVYVLPDGTRTRGDAVTDWGEIPPGTRVLLDEAEEGAARVSADPIPGVDGLLVVGHPVAAAELLGSAASADTTTYLFPSGEVLSGAELHRAADGRVRLDRLPAGTRVLVGYVNHGKVARGESVIQTAGSRWNDPRTYYRTPSGRVRSGEEIDQRHVAPGTLVFLRQ